MGAQAKSFITFFVILLFSSSSCFGRKTGDRNFKLTSKVSKHSHHKRGHAKHNGDQLVLNVDDFGAKADGESDNFQAFKKAWEKACNSLESTKILVPGGKIYYVKHINFTGPCRSSIAMEIQGTIRSFPQMYDIPRRLWIKFEDVRNIDVIGGGTIDGNGEVWWKNSCKIKKTKALTFNNCTNLRVSTLKLVNAQQMHVNFQDCNGVEASKLLVVAPEQSPNTDGIHITRTLNINILDSVVKTGDDCISIVNGSRNVGVRNIVCGPGHGISIGSLGEDNTENHVSDILVKGVMLTGTTNGVRIKTWQGGSGIARNIEFEDIEMRNVSNPIIINQNYCDKNKKCQRQASAVQVENVIYRNIRGTSASKVAINFNCSDSVPCRNVVVDNVKLSGQAKGEKVEALCSNLAMLSAKLNSAPTCSMHK
ncbi:polygalacturonase [Phtheirospermum japonicum]|uniref:endo-polygalacturonase n=1 Tax=Phtheirospermum japonicum TaxID=374723 RepID=A0A830C0H9_9LAMI|nr:polygalacturonase [Phtheirospermum japonicum]